MSHPVLRIVLALLASSALANTTSYAQSVAMTGVMGSKALLVINGGAPKALSANESHQGVRVIQVQGNSATIEWQGQHQTLRVGGSPVSVGQGLGGGRKVVLRADSRGHFRESGYINNKPMEYMVDTGASIIGIGLTDAQRMGLDYEKGARVNFRTANGNALGWHVRLDTVRVGDLTVYGVDAIVGPQPMPYVLLGNSFLSQVHMTRRGNEMVLEMR
ncbi:TIGR02281 family clan AA aspartic protease [Comamonas sp. NoAH]|uniref:retropepsin-like aspartic protease family protein n=1 Tax=Comamonas halotolerans TaxID=3041496 RepID=UPI0024E0A4CD|nr:TIGR02281 family clan AA aspartic protease [Comamonas sp. NoAH]